MLVSKSQQRSHSARSAESYQSKKVSRSWKAYNNFPVPSDRSTFSHQRSIKIRFSNQEIQCDHQCPRFKTNYPVSSSPRASGPSSPLLSPTRQTPSASTLQSQNAKLGQYCPGAAAKKTRRSAQKIGTGRGSKENTGQAFCPREWGTETSGHIQGKKTAVPGLWHC